ncbi:MAG: 1-acyl-sn-glycerol-3-phosphate acyltransferase [Nitrospirae bacterium]|nr:1-acyl-sn-glycerol-3-phosphate acyltransferase [Nitrospirota bacterium]
MGHSSITDADTYITVSGPKRSALSRRLHLPGWIFYPRAFWIVYRNGKRALKGRYGDREWAESSFEILRALEKAGVEFEITGMDMMRKFEGPAVFIANHMGTLETMVLPCLIQPLKTATFVVKKSLITMPFFGPIMRSRDPVVVGRVNPRDDLRAVLEKGAEKLRAGISVVVFPQSTRSVSFNPGDFNTLGVKLAARAGVPVVPVALKTDAWGIGGVLKEFGPIDVGRKVYFRFGEPMTISGRGAGEHEKIVDFISDNLSAWADKDGPGADARKGHAKEDTCRR